MAYKKQELLNILDRWNETLEEMNKFGVIIPDVKHHHMDSEAFFDGRFAEATIAIEDFDSEGGRWAYRAIVTIDDYTFTCLVTKEELEELSEAKKVELR